MNMRWNLNALYTSFESKEFINDIKKCDDTIFQINRWTLTNLRDLENPVQKIEEYLSMAIDFSSIIDKILSYSYLVLSVEAKNVTALKYIEKFEEKLTELTSSDVNFQMWLGSLKNIDEVILSSELLKEHNFYLKEIVQKNKYLLKDNEETIISKLRNTGSSAWSKLQEYLTSTLTVEIVIDGEEKHLPLPVVRNMAYESSSSLRKIAYEAELNAYNKIQESSAACLNGIKGETITLCRIRGYKSPLDQVLLNSRMDESTLNAMITAMKESLPIFRKYFRKKAELLGHTDSLPFYDLFAPIGEMKMHYTYEEAKEFIVKNFRCFSNKLANFAENAFNNDWIDAEPRKGKRGGAFCSNIHSIKQSRILSNFTGSYNDVSTLAHELGHGYHNLCTNNETLLNINTPMPLAETASIFCETIIANAAINSSSKEQALVILENDIMSSAQVIVDILSRFLFESEVFEKREEGSLSVEELKTIMINAQKQTYGEGLNENFMHPLMWVCKPHYYSADANFYNFPYAFGQLFGKGLFSEYLKRGNEFVNEYDNMLSVTGKRTIAEVAAMMKIDVHSIDFWRSSLKLIEKDIEKFISLC
jgi:pepF/M3 family oligoendopeptidase